MYHQHRELIYKATLCTSSVESCFINQPLCWWYKQPLYKLTAYALGTTVAF